MKADLILTADIHLRETTPKCRTDDYWQAQANKIKFLRETQLDNDMCPIIDAGDFLHKWKSEPYLLTWAINNMPKIYSVPGNHDLPKHNIDLLGKSGFSTLVAADKIRMLPLEHTTHSDIDIMIVGYHWGLTPFDKSLTKKRDSKRTRTVAVCHHAVYKGREPWHGALAQAKAGTNRFMDHAHNANQFFSKISKRFDLIVTGHYHDPFVAKSRDKKRLLVNPGSMMRMTANQIEHKPRLYLYYAKSNSVEAVYYPIQDDVINRDHIDIAEQKIEKINAFAKRMSDDIELELSFESNLERYAKKNGIGKRVMNIIYEAMEQ